MSPGIMELCYKATVILVVLIHLREENLGPAVPTWCHYVLMDSLKLMGCGNLQLGGGHTWQFYAAWVGDGVADLLDKPKMGEDNTSHNGDSITKVAEHMVYNKELSPLYLL